MRQHAPAYFLRNGRHPCTAFRFRHNLFYSRVLPPHGQGSPLSQTTTTGSAGLPVARVLRVRTHYQEQFFCGLLCKKKQNITSCYENVRLCLPVCCVRVLGKMGEFEGEETPFCRKQKGFLPPQKNNESEPKGKVSPGCSGCAAAPRHYRRAPCRSSPSSIRRSSSAPKSSPMTAASCGTRLVGVMPGRVFTSSRVRRPSGDRMKSVRL